MRLASGPAAGRWRGGTERGTSTAMEPRRSPRTPLAGGMPIALGAILGALSGGLYRQPTIGFLVGLGIGVAVALAVWLIDRR